MTAITPNDKITERVITQMRKVADDLEKFQVQVALGKAEAKDQFEATRKQFLAVVRKMQERLSIEKPRVKELTDLLVELQVKLSEGKATTIAEYKKQRKELIDLLEALENAIALKLHALEGNEHYLKLKHEIHKMQIKLEIIRFRLDLKKTIVKSEYLSRMKAFHNKLSQFKSIGPIEEMNKAYRKLRHAFTLS